MNELKYREFTGEPSKSLRVGAWLSVGLLIVLFAVTLVLAGQGLRCFLGH